MRNAHTAARRPGSAALRFLAGAGAGIVLSLSGPGSGYAFDELILEQIDHFIECKLLLLSAPAEHAEKCLPSRVPASFGTLAPKGPPAAPPQQDEACDGTIVDGVCVPNEESCPEGESMGSDGQCYPLERYCEGSLDGGTCYVEKCTQEQREDPFYYCFDQQS